MSTYPTEPQSIMQLIGHSFAHYGKVLKAIIPLILLATLVKDLYIYWGGMPHAQTLQMIIIIIMIILEIYFWLAALYTADLVLRRQPTSVKTACRAIYYKWSSVYAGVFLFILAWCAVFFIGYLISAIVISIFPDKLALRALSYLILIGIPLTIVSVLCFFAIPILTINNVQLIAAFRESIKLVGYQNWLRTFVAYAAIIITLMVVLPVTRHGYWLQRHYLSFLFDAVVFTLLAPLIINFILLLLNDLRLLQEN